MQKISLIAIIDENLGLGLNNHLLCRLPADLKHFKAKTLGKPVLMGRKTFLSVGKALPGRRNIVLCTKNLDFPDIEAIPSLEEALDLLKQAPEIMIIGGATLYQQCLPFANYMYLTRIHHRFKADVFFPEWDPSAWQCTGDTFLKADENNPYDLSFQEYSRKKFD